MQRIILCLFALFYHVIVFGQSQCDNIKANKVIPLVKYSTNNFTQNVHIAFRDNPSGIYYFVEEEKGQILSNCGGNCGYACISKPLRDLISNSTDSLFFIYFHDDVRHSENLCGRLKNGIIQTVDAQGKWYSSVEDYIRVNDSKANQVYGDTKRISLEHDTTLLGMKEYLVNSYEFYETCNPWDTSGVVSRFVAELEKNSLVQKTGKKALQQQLELCLTQKGTDKEMLPCCVYVYGGDKMMLMGINIARIMYDNLSSEDYQNIMWYLMKRQKKFNHDLHHIYLTEYADKDNVQYLTPEEELSLISQSLCPTNN
jgi:hypothetical protein